MGGEATRGPLSPRARNGIRAASVIVGSILAFALAGVSPVSGLVVLSLVTVATLDAASRRRNVGRPARHRSLELVPVLRIRRRSKG